MLAFYLERLRHDLWQSDRAVLWTWRRMIHKTRLEWRRGGDRGSNLL